MGDKFELQINKWTIFRVFEMGKDVFKTNFEKVNNIVELDFLDYILAKKCLRRK